MSLSALDLLTIVSASLQSAVPEVYVNNWQRFTRFDNAVVVLHKR